MSSQYVRVAGNIYGPFSPEQLGQMRNSGRVNDQTEVSADRVTWRALGGNVNVAPNVIPIPLGSDGDTVGRQQDMKGYLERLRNQTHYPFYRTVVLVASVLGYVAAAIPLVALTVRVIWFGLSSITILQPVAAVIGSVLLVVIVTVAREVASMFADFVDSTLMRHAKDDR
jgi:hypothetical protein